MTDKQQAIFDLIVELKERLEQARTELKELNRWIHEEAPRIAVEESRGAVESLRKQLTEAQRRAKQWRLAAEEESWPFEWQVATEYKERAERAEAENARLLTILEAHRRFHGKVGCPDGAACYVCIAEAEEANSISPGDGTLRIKKGR